MTPAAVERLRCPRCRAAVDYDGSLANGALAIGTLHCGGCGAAWPVRGGIPDLVDAAEVRGFEWLIRQVYQLIAPFHDLAVRYVLPLATFWSEDAVREHIVGRLELAEVQPPAGEPVRILEVGVGGGANLPFLERGVPAGLAAELWGVDFSGNMLAQCVRRVRRWRGRPVHLLLADAHALPFPDATFDRVLHVGAVATYRDPARAFAEMARVARPGAAIVAVDERFDPDAAAWDPRSWYQWLAFRSMTLYEWSPHAPIEHLPADAYDVRVEQAGTFFYCLSFRARGVAAMSSAPPA